jgi:predicted acylesterase/phospholipase RssA
VKEGAIASTVFITATIISNKLISQPIMNSTKIHLVCSSGGVKCFSYLGAVRNLYKYNIEIASISACSMGTVLGALIASGKDLVELEEKLVNFNFKLLNTKKRFAFISSIFPPFATHHMPDYAGIMQALLGEDIRLSQLKIPFSALALDIRQKRFLVYSSSTHPDMRISEVIKIATSIPFMYPPYKLEKRILVDAAVATESPVWMAVNQKGNYPIVVLKVMKEIDSSYNNSFIKYLPHLISVSAESHDYFAASQITRNIDININCEKMSYANFKITKEQVENLILQGEAAAEQQLKEFNYDLSHIITIAEQPRIEEIGAADNQETVSGSDSVNAVNLADKMIAGFKNEISKRNQVFVSYSNKDKIWLERLNVSLSTLERFAGIKAWNDTYVPAGNNLNHEINNALSATKIAIFLVTPDFLVSKFIKENEVNYFFDENNREKIPILWIAISASNFEITPLRGIACANDPARPLDTLTPAEQNIEFAKICKKILDLMRY